MGAYLYWVPKGGAAKTLLFDVVTDETQELAVTITEHPVEDGPNVADHIRRELNAVSLECQVSNAPVFDVNGRGAKVEAVELKMEKFKAPLAPNPGSAYKAIGGAISSLFSGEEKHSATVMQFPKAFDAVGDTLAILEKIRDDETLVQVALPSKIYKDMCLVKLTMKRNASIGDAAAFHLEFKEVRKVKVNIVAAPKPTEKRAVPMKQRGSQDPKDVKVPAQKKSLLSGLLK